MLKLSNFSKKGSMKMISTLNEIMKCMESNDTIIIHRHVDPDPDAYGSQLGLKYYIQAENSAKASICSG